MIYIYITKYYKPEYAHCTLYIIHCVHYTYIILMPNIKAIISIGQYTSPDIVLYLHVILTKMTLILKQSTNENNQVMKIAYNYNVHS